MAVLPLRGDSGAGADAHTVGRAFGSAGLAPSADLRHRARGRRSDAELVLPPWQPAGALRRSRGAAGDTDRPPVHRAAASPRGEAPRAAGSSRGSADPDGP